MWLASVFFFLNFFVLFDSFVHVERCTVFWLRSKPHTKNTFLCSKLARNSASLIRLKIGRMRVKPEFKKINDKIKRGKVLHLDKRMIWQEYTRIGIYWPDFVVVDSSRCVKAKRSVPLHIGASATIHVIQIVQSMQYTASCSLLEKANEIRKSVDDASADMKRNK